MVGEFLRGRGKIRNEISRVGREEKEKCRNASKTSPLQLPSSILSLRSHPRFPFFNVISQASDPAGFRFPFLFRAHLPLFPRHLPSQHRFIENLSLDQCSLSFFYLSRSKNPSTREHGWRKQSIPKKKFSLSIYLSIFSLSFSLKRKTIFPRSNSGWTLFKSFDSHSIYLSRSDTCRCSIDSYLTKNHDSPAGERDRDS